MEYKTSKRNWKSKQQTKTGYGDSAGAKEEGRSGREEFKKDVAEAVTKGVKGAKGKGKKPKGAKGKKPKGAVPAYDTKRGLDTWSVAELRKLLNGKKHNLLTKAGFPDGKLPRSKVGMIALCKKLKRKRW
jgi:hypothetical protein